MLCRTNAKAMAEAMNAMAASSRKVAITGGGREILALAEAAITLKAGTGTSHPELFAFRTWGEVQDYAENDPGGSDLQVLVKLIDDHGPETIIDAVRRLSDERYASLIISTAHKAKGREWDTVRIAVGRLLAGPLGYSLQANAKTVEGKQHPDRDAQFGYINDRVTAALAAGEPVYQRRCEEEGTDRRVRQQGPDLASGRESAQDRSS